MIGEWLESLFEIVIGEWLKSRFLTSDWWVIGITIFRDRANTCQAVVTFSMRDIFEVASGNLSTSSWTMAHRFLIGFKSRLFPDYVPLSQKKAKLEPHNSWVLFCCVSRSSVLLKNWLGHVLQQFSAQNIQILLHEPVDGGVGCRLASCRQSSSELSGWLTFPPKFLAMTILAVLERIDQRSPPDLLSMDSTFLFWRY